MTTILSELSDLLYDMSNDVPFRYAASMKAEWLLQRRDRALKALGSDEAELLETLRSLVDGMANYLSSDLSDAGNFKAMQEAFSKAVRVLERVEGNLR